MEIKDKIIKKFKDSENNLYEIRQKNNGHFYLIIKENKNNFGKIIER